MLLAALLTLAGKRIFNLIFSPSFAGGSIVGSSLSESGSFSDLVSCCGVSSCTDASDAIDGVIAAVGYVDCFLNRSGGNKTRYRSSNMKATSSISLLRLSPSTTPLVGINSAPSCEPVGFAGNAVVGSDKNADASIVRSWSIRSFNLYCSCLSFSFSRSRCRFSKVSYFR